MKRLLTVLAVLVGMSAVAGAQNRPVYDREGRFFVSAQGGLAASFFENVWTYKDYGKLTDINGAQGSISVGYDFNTMWAVRLNVGYGARNNGAYNMMETDYHRRFRPYHFKSVNAFADVILDLNGVNGNIRRFSPKLYAGIGLGHTMDFQDDDLYAGDPHPWQTKYLTNPNNALGGRLGFIGEYCFASGFGLYVDAAGEAYTDNYNGLKPQKEWEKATKNGHYSGTPFDVRGMLSFGIIYHF